MLRGLYRESIGYRYWNSLGTVLRGRDTPGRIDAFSYSLVACATLIALLAFWFGNAEQAEDPIACLFAAMQWGSMFYLPGSNHRVLAVAGRSPAYQAAQVFPQLLADVYVRERPARINHEQPLHVSQEPKRAD